MTPSLPFPSLLYPFSLFWSDGVDETRLDQTNCHYRLARELSLTHSQYTLTLNVHDSCYPAASTSLDAAEIDIPMSLLYTCNTLLHHEETMASCNAPYCGAWELLTQFLCLCGGEAKASHQGRNHRIPFALAVVASLSADLNLLLYQITIFAVLY
eukprot:scaffold633_cov288-Ochromonas_danica.AAC.25